MRSRSHTAGPSRRELLQRTGTWALAATPFIACGGVAAVCLRSAWPERVSPLRLPVGPLRALAVGASVKLRPPRGAPLTVVRTGSGAAPSDFVALSSRCPHLGCPVTWNARRERYECPCHQGRFDAAGQPLSGPPLAAGTPLASYPLVVEEGLLYVVLPPAQAARGAGQRADGASDATSGEAPLASPPDGRRG